VTSKLLIEVYVAWYSLTQNSLNHKTSLFIDE